MALGFQHRLGDDLRARKTFFEMVRARTRSRPEVPSFPSAAARQCTSDLKRGPIYKFIRGDMKARGAAVGINCMGLRAEESTARKKMPPWNLNKALSNRRRTVYNWLPIHEMTEHEVFGHIRAIGQEPFWAYAAGNRRLSCVFCIFGCAEDIANGPELYSEYRRLERALRADRVTGR